MPPARKIRPRHSGKIPLPERGGKGFLLPTCYSCLSACYSTYGANMLSYIHEPSYRTHRRSSRNPAQGKAKKLHCRTGNIHSLRTPWPGPSSYSLTSSSPAPEEPKVVGYITPDDAPPSDTPPPPEVQRETSSASHAETPVKVVVAAAAAPAEPAQDRH